MKILIDVAAHPSHVHTFKNFIWSMEKRGHEFLITACDKDVSFQLLNAYKFKYENVGKYGKSILSKIKDMMLIDYRMYKIAKEFKPDILLGFGPVNVAHVSTLIRKPCIALEDTEPEIEQQILFVPFIEVVLTPSSFKKSFGRKQVRFNGFKELAYLHPNYFKPNPEVLDELNLSKDDRFVILRFVSWSATHDIGQRGFSLESKIKIVKELEKHTNVFITSESKLNKNLKKYEITISPEKIHDALYYATMLIGDSQTMTTEAGILGTQAIRCNSWVGPNDMSNFIELEKKYGLIYSFRDADKALNKALELLKNPNLKQELAKKRKKLLNDKIDVTAFMVWFIENYPESFKEMKENPDIQKRFT